MKSNLLTVLIVITVFASFSVKAQKTRELTQEEEDNKKASQKRVALVIGNGAYTKAKPLPNPSNDAADMAQTLRDLGFEVISGTNQTKRQTETLIREFGTKLAASGGIGLFYYAGHGLQVSGENYIVPVDADIPEEDEVAYSAVPISLVLTKMMTAKNDLNIVILDACRNNPFARSWRSFRDNSSSDGLAKISPPTGTLVLYATEPGKVASDGAGRNGLFTESLLKQIKRPNLEYDQMVKALSLDVWQKSNKQQLPWKEGNTLQDFYFSETTTNVIQLPIKNKSGFDSNWSRIRETAKSILKYNNTFEFSDEFATVSTKDSEKKRYGFINKKGEEIIPAKYDFAYSFSEGLAAILIGNFLDGYWGFIDKTGKEVIPSKYIEVRSFSEELASVKVGNSQVGKWGFIDKTGKEVISIKYDSALSFSEGLAAVKLSNSDKWGFIDKTGKEIIPAKYANVLSFSQGLAPIQIDNSDTSRWGFIDKTGKIVITAKYTFVAEFSEGLARITVGTYPNIKFGFIDKTGKEIIPAKYDTAFTFSQGLAYVTITGKAGFIDKSGKEVIPIKYDNVWSFAFQKEGFYGVILNGKKGFVDIYGNEYFDF